MHGSRPASAQAVKCFMYASIFGWPALSSSCIPRTMCAAYHLQAVPGGGGVAAEQSSHGERARKEGRGVHVWQT